MGLFDIKGPESIFELMFDNGLLKELDDEVAEPVEALLTGEAVSQDRAEAPSAASGNDRQQTAPAERPQPKPAPGNESLARKLYGK